jgi:NitT/TauT family transport system substrate-binding protein
MTAFGLTARNQKELLVDMYSFRRNIAMIVCLATGMCLTSIFAADKPTQKSASLVLHWDHQAQFAGYYMALDKGFYAAEGLDVTIIRGGPNVRSCELTGSGKATFCTTMLSTALEKRENGIPLVLIAQIVNRSNFEVVAWKKPDGKNGREILKPSDLAGRRITIWEQDFRLPYMAFLDAQDIKPEIIPQYYSLSLFLNHGADACSAMRYNEYHWLLQHGVNPDDLTVFNLCDNGVPLPEDGIYTLDSTYEKDPAMCRAFAKASIAGWVYARQHPDEALEAVMRRVDEASLPTNRAHMQWMLKEMLDSIFPCDSSGWILGKLSPNSYRQVTTMLKRFGAIVSAPDYESFVKQEEKNHVEPN